MRTGEHRISSIPKVLVLCPLEMISIVMFIFMFLVLFITPIFISISLDCFLRMVSYSILRVCNPIRLNFTILRGYARSHVSYVHSELPLFATSQELQLSIFQIQTFNLNYACVKKNNYTT